MNKAQLTERFNQIVNSIEQAFNDFVDNGTDQELFLSGYLHGHFSLVVSQAELAQDLTLEGMKSRMEASLQNAFSQGELAHDDQGQALAMWETLFSESCEAAQTPETTV